MKVPFIKMVGAGNDFVFIDRGDLARNLTTYEIQSICHRRDGIGADQVLIASIQGSIIDMRVFNADGTPAEQCGNGTRCIAHWYLSKNGTLPQINTTQLKIKTPRHKYTAHKMIDVKLGAPTWPSVDTTSLRLPHNIEVVDYVMFGNPHLVLWTKNLTNISVESLGTFCATHPIFPKGTNVHFAQKRQQDLVSIRVWERGAGETGSCGSGACSVVASGRKLGYLKDAVTLEYRSDDLHIYVDSQEMYWLSGSARITFEGIIDCEA